jgi:transcriptional regulator with XRE-family HTH domain
VQEAQRAVGAAIRRLRRERGWTQDILAEKAGLHRAHVGEIERGQANITLLTLKTIADTLRVRVADLVRAL